MRGFPNDEGGYDHCNAIESTKFMRFNMGYLEMRARIPDGTEVHFFYDGTEYYSHPTDEFFVGKYLELLAGFNVGREKRIAPDASIEWPLEYHIDYIRLYQVDGQGLICE